MIGITGFMSGGKSYYAVEHMLGMMIQHHRVASNIILQCQAVTSYTGIPCVFWKQLYYSLVDKPNGYHQIAVDDYDHYPHGSPRGSADYERRICYIYLDEASSIFDSITHSADNKIQTVAAWCRHTEKRGQRLFLIMQFASELHKRVRVHITEFVSCTNSSSLKVPFLGIGLPRIFRNMTIRSRYCADGETQIGRAKWYALNPAIYNCYKTSQIVVGSNDVEPYIPVVIDDTVRIERIKTRRFCLLCLFYFILLLTCFFFVGFHYEI